MEPDTPRLGLVLQGIHVTDEGDSNRVLLASARVIADRFQAAGLWRWPLESWTSDKEGSRREIQSSDVLLAEIAKRAPNGVVVGGGAERSTTVEIFDRKSEIIISCLSPIGSSASADLLSTLVETGRDIWAEVQGRATVGPGFAVRPIGPDYPRPLPPRRSFIWNAGDAAYLICHAFHDTSPIGEPDAIEKMRSAKLPEEIVRENAEGMTIVRCKGPAEDPDLFAHQRFALEVWLSSVLELPLDREFRETGDRRIGVVRAQAAGPFTFYDPVIGTAYKAVPQTEADDLDREDADALKEALKTRELPDGRKVRRAVAVFPTREAAVHNHKAVTALGAAGVSYIGDNGELWDPDPPGNWVRMEWDRLP